MIKGVRIVFLWAEVTGYVRGVLNALVEMGGVAIDVVHWDKLGVYSTQYQVGVSSSISFHGRSQTNPDKILKLLVDRQPSIIVVSGWMDKGYVWACRRYKKKFPNTKIVAGIDDQWS